MWSAVLAVVRSLRERTTARTAEPYFSNAIKRDKGKDPGDAVCVVRRFPLVCLGYAFGHGRRPEVDTLVVPHKYRDILAIWEEWAISRRTRR